MRHVASFEGGKDVEETPEQLAEIAARNAKHNSVEEKEKRRVAAILAARNDERGSLAEQWEYFIDNGYDALKSKDDAIKAKHPK